MQSNVEQNIGIDDRPRNHKMHTSDLIDGPKPHTDTRYSQNPSRTTNYSSAVGMQYLNAASRTTARSIRLIISIYWRVKI